MIRHILKDGTEVEAVAGKKIKCPELGKIIGEIERSYKNDNKAGRGDLAGIQR